MKHPFFPFFVCFACFVGGLMFSDAVDAPHTVSPAELRIAAETIEEAIKITIYSVQHRTEINGENRTILASSASAPWGHDVTVIGNCATAWGSRELVLGDRATTPIKGDGFVNLGNKLCFWRDTGTIVDCPPPEPECQ